LSSTRTISAASLAASVPLRPMATPPFSLRWLTDAEANVLTQLYQCVWKSAQSGCQQTVSLG
jgi:hypothetical protein